MKPELIGRYPAAGDRVQIGRFLRYAFPLKLDAFSHVMRGFKGDERWKAPSAIAGPLGMESRRKDPLAG
jgi:hypothetical protein